MRKVFYLVSFLFFLTSYFIGHVDVQEIRKEITIGFTQSFSTKDLVIEKIAAYNEDNKIIFTIFYKSKKDRFLSLFNPPQGDKLEYFDRNGIKKNKKSVIFAIPREQFKDVAKISMRFSDNEDPEPDRNFIFLNIYKKNVMDLLGIDIKNLPGFKPKTKKFDSVKKFKDVRWGDLTAITDPLSLDMIATLNFNLDTKFGKSTDNGTAVLEKGKNPGLGVKSIHKRGITGRGVNVGIIDQNLCLSHPEFKGKVVQYKDIGCNQPPNRGSMHAPGVLGLLAGTTLGTAPDVHVYFSAAPSWTQDTKYQAEALEWILEVNQSLPKDSRIKVVSVSAAPSGKGSPFNKNTRLWDKAFKKAKKEGILVLDCTKHHGIIGPCYYDIHDPDDLSKCKIGYPGMTMQRRPPKNRIYAPCSFRTTAEEYNDGNPSYQYHGRGGLSWSVPYVAGVLALGWQVKPDLKDNEIVRLLFKTAYITDDSYKIINPVAFIDAVEKLKIQNKANFIN